MFDVSHMGQARLEGDGVVAAFEALVPGDIVGLKPGRQRYTLFTNEAGGIIDDLMVANPGDGSLFLVVNAARKAVDFAHLRLSLPETVRLVELPDRALMALQGPLAAAVLGRLAPEAVALPFMGFAAIAIGGIACWVSRSGYTGEDGFEISVPAEHAEALARLLLDAPEVVPAGLGARDSLRLEAGLPLYGNDLDEVTTPVEAGLTWVIGKRRKLAWDFPGALVARDQLDNGPTRVRVGLRPDGRAPARAGTTIVDADGNEAGSGHLGRLLAQPECADRDGLCAPRRRRRRHGAVPAGARQAAARDRRADAVRPTPLQTLKEPSAMSDTRYTKDHEWVRLDGDIVTVGITDHAQEALGDVVFVELPEVDREVVESEACAVVESVKAASDVYAPLAGKVVEINEMIVEDPALVNGDPTGEAWFFKLELERPGRVRGTDGRGRLHRVRGVRGMSGALVRACRTRGERQLRRPAISARPTPKSPRC